MAFVFSVYGGMRVGEIAAVKIKDVANQYGEARREIKLASDQTKGSHSRTVVLSNRVRKEIEAYLKQYPSAHPDWPLIRSQRGQAFSSLTLSMLFKEIYELAGIKCVIRRKAASDSDAIRPPIPTEVGHPFRLKPATLVGVA